MVGQHLEGARIKLLRTDLIRGSVCAGIASWVNSWIVRSRSLLLLLFLLQKKEREEKKKKKKKRIHNHVTVTPRYERESIEESVDWEQSSHEKQKLCFQRVLKRKREGTWSRNSGFNHHRKQFRTNKGIGSERKHGDIRVSRETCHSGQKHGRHEKEALRSSVLLGYWFARMPSRLLSNRYLYFLSLKTNLHRCVYQVYIRYIALFFF